MTPQTVIQSHHKGQTGVSKNCRNKQPVTSKKDLIYTPNKGESFGKEVVCVVEYDGKIRELVVPRQEPTVPPLLLDTDEFNRIKQQTKVNINVDDMAFCMICFNGNTSDSKMIFVSVLI
jgi:hypothetical protein